MGSDFTLYLVLGMHRSGTSVTAKALNRIGVPTSDTMLAADQFNEDGYFEDATIVELHDLLLSAAGQPWGSTRHLGALKPDVIPPEARAEIKTRLSACLSNLIEANRDAGCLFIKDPRMCLFLPMWKELAVELNVSLRAVFVFRPVEEVAASLARRDRLAPDHSRLLWLKYNARMIVDGRDLQHVVVPHPAWSSDGGKVVEMLADFAGLPVPNDKETIFRAELTQGSDEPLAGLLAGWGAALARQKLGSSLTDEIVELAERFLTHYEVIFQVAAEEANASAREHALVRDLSSYRDAARDYKDAYEKQGAQIESFKVQIESFKVQVDGYQAQVEDYQAQVEDYQAQIEDFNAQLVNAEAKLSDLRKLHNKPVALVAHLFRVSISSLLRRIAPKGEHQ